MRLWWVPFVLLQLFGSSVDEKNKEGAALYEEGKFDEALVAFTQAQEELPDAPEIHYNIGNVHFRKQEMEKALEEYRTSLRGSPDVQARAHFNSGNVYYQAQSYAEAIEEYKQGLKIDDRDLEARQNLELALQKQQEQQQQQQNQDESSEEGDQEQQQQQQQGQQEHQEQGDQEQQDASQAPPPDQMQSGDSSQEQAQPQEMSREEAERILAALAEMERAEQRKQQETERRRAPSSGKDW